MISNPISTYIGTSFDKREFRYEGGLLLYHFSAHDSNIPGYSHYHGINIVFFANDKEHAMDVLERMVKWARKNTSKKSSSYNVAANLLKYKDQWKVEEAPMDQFYSVGWADNDTLF